MTTNLPTTLAGASVPMDTESMADYFQEQGNRLSSGGKQFLKFSKGDWTIGRENETFPQNGFEFVPNMMGLMHGFQCWKGGMPVDEALVSFFKPMPDKSQLADHSPYPNPQQDGWQETIKLPMIILPRMGVKASIEAEFSTSSSGGKTALGNLNKEFGAYLKTGQYGGQLPIVRATASSYKHATYGKVHVPIFQIVDWVAEADLHAILSGGPKPAKTPAKTAVAAPATQAPAAQATAAVPAVQDTTAPASVPGASTTDDDLTL